jgi:serine protease inhibitor
MTAVSSPARVLARLGLALLVTAATAACRDSAGPAEDAPGKLTELPRALTTGERQLVQRSNAFSFGLLAAVNARHQGKNVFISPLSASMALGMTMNGAAGETLDQMRSTLGFAGVELPEINSSYRSLIDLLRGLDRRVDFRIANSIWYQQGFPFEQEFLTTAARSFDAEVAGVDFRNAEATKSRINDWVSDETAGKIPTIIETLSGDEVMFLINAMYFKGSWRDRFKESETQSAPFHKDDGTTQPVRLMHRRGPVRAARRADVTVVESAYGADAYTMTVLLPPAGTTVDDFVRGLTEETWVEWMKSLAEQEAILYLPKFKLTWEDKLNDPLQALGMRLPFTAADFTGMSRSRGRELVISEVKQKTFVDVNEEGTEAAAVTSVGIAPTCACGPAEIRIDRPFVFAIRERLSGTILFVGKIVAP